MNSPIDSSHSDACEPPYADWSSILSENVAARQQRFDRLARLDLQTMREEICAAAHAYTSGLNSIAAEVGLRPPVDLRQQDEEAGSLARRPIVASGHQPIIFHPGILAKNLRLEQLSTHNEAVGLMILIDTDQGDASRFLYPTTTAERRLTLQTASLGDGGGGLFLSQAIGDSHAVSEIANQVVNALEDFGFKQAAEQTVEVMKQYACLGGQPAAIANSIVRRIWEGRPNYLEVPLSTIVALPSMRQFWDVLIKKGDVLHESYNATLSKYRTDHKIRNRANPFPNLPSDGNLFELPFWIMESSSGTRQPLRVTSPASLESSPSLQIVPRGMMITTLLRIVASDLFIHGTGGAKYDRCTDQFVAKMFQVAPPNFVAATATCHLFAEELKDVANSRALREQIQETCLRFKRHTESGTFEGEDQQIATALLKRRFEAIERLKLAKAARQSAVGVNEELKAIEVDVIRFVERVVTKGKPLHEPGRERLEVLENRTFPFFFFEQPTARKTV